MRRTSSIILIAILAILLLSAGSYLIYGKDNAGSIKINEDALEEAGPVAAGNLEEENPAPTPAIRAEEKENLLPERVFIEVPFLVQAPFAVWDPLHEDACEEASLIMVDRFLDNEKAISPIDGDVDIRKMVRYEEENGYAVDVTMDELNQISKDYLGRKTGRVKVNPTIDDIKKELAEGRPVIVPAAGKILPNPYFRGDGPDYHMLVVVGYDKNGFVTNDPGTKRGKGFRYAFDALYGAIHDWNNGNDILGGQKAYLVFD
jgi:hypothetical protein